MSTPNLKEFLMEHGAFRQFCDNLKSNEEGAIADFDEYAKMMKADRTESDGGLFAFLWADTPEGFYFWNNIDTLWQKYYFKCVHNG